METNVNETSDIATLDSMKGAFVESLKRNSKKIREDRAIDIAENAKMMYKRKIEDYQKDLRSMKRERSNMLDLSPTTTDSLILATDFKAEEFVSKDIELGVNIRNLEIKLEISTKQYEHLFGEKIVG